MQPKSTCFRFARRASGFLCSVAMAIMTSVVVADDPIQPPWQAPYEPLSAVDPEPTLAILVITNDDPFRTVIPVQGGQNADDDNQDRKALPWCISDMADAYRTVIMTRKDLKDKISMQMLPAGLPLELTGGQAGTDPARAIVAICDARYHLLSLTVGIPTGDQLMGLIEDAEETRTFANQFSEDPKRMHEALAERSAPRVSRFYRAALMEMAEALGDEVDADNSAPSASMLLTADQVYRACETLEPIYLADVRLRFGLRKATDLRRLLVLEHHVQTRRPWSESITPMMAMMDTETLLPALVESVWGHRPIDRQPSIDDKALVTWAKGQFEDNAMAFAIEPPATMRFIPWPPIADPSRRGTTWTEIDQLAKQLPFRMLNLSTLAHVIRDLELRPVDVRGSVVRYVLTQPKRAMAQVIREADPPGRFATMLSKNQSSLLKK